MIRRTAILLMALALCAAACAAPPAAVPSSAGPSAAAEPREAACSVFLYLCGGDLETRHGSATQNLQELLDAHAGGGVNIIVQTGGTAKWRGFGISNAGLQRYAVERGELKLLEDLPDASMGSAETLADFLLYGIRNHPARRYAVILWNHGGGSVGGIAFDERHGGDALTLDELGAALSRACGEMGGRFGLIGLDACLMATVETAQTLAPWGDYLVASQEISPSEGWDYAAIAGSLSRDPAQGGDALGRTVCDSYYRKCLARGKEQTVTMSVVDLRRMDAVAAGLDALAAEMEGEAERAGLCGIARRIGSSPGYGGATRVEGFSNLFDLGCFAGEMGVRALCEALGEAVVHRCAGPQRADASGLSFYYPLALDRAELARYLRVCPSPGYAAFLSAAYAGLPEGAVAFEDDGSLSEDGEFTIRLRADSLRAVAMVECELTGLDARGSPVLLGTCGILRADWEAGVFAGAFPGGWPALDGRLLQSRPIDETGGSILFSAPVLHNGRRENLRFSFAPDGTGGGSYEILGVWSGLDDGSGVSLAELQPLREGDEITALRASRQGACEPGESLVYGGDSAIVNRPLEEGTYHCRIVVTDIFGNAHASAAAVYAVERTDGGGTAARPAGVVPPDAR